MTITNIVKDFIKCWKIFNQMTSLSDEEAAKKINSGDCGLAAIAIYFVLLHKFNVETQIYSNSHHCWLNHNGTDFDTAMPRGYSVPANEVWSKEFVEDQFQLSLPHACSEFMPCDTLGAYLVKAFVERYDLALPQELQHCIDKGEEYDSPSYCLKYKQWHDTVKNTPI